MPVSLAEAERHAEEYHASHVRPDGATTTTPPGHSSTDNPLETRSQLEAHIASVGIHAYVAELGAGSDPAYRAWEAVRDRKAGRAGELVGKVFGFDGSLLPYTGFEGDFAGLPSARIVEMEENLGEQILRGIHYKYGMHEASSGPTEREVLAALHGKPMSVRHVREILEFFDCLFKEILAKAEPDTPSEAYRLFRTVTYQGLESGRASTESVQPNTRVTISTPRKTEAYRVLAEIGVFGHDGLKKLHKIGLDEIEAIRAETAIEEPCLDSVKFARLAFPVPAGLLDDDNPLSR
jgi:hypothetical protein